ncbi:hypothetical protein BKA80DRAFT_74663 [Phyllosticta citrichinensis]
METSSLTSRVTVLHRRGRPCTFSRADAPDEKRRLRGSELHFVCWPWLAGRDSSPALHSVCMRYVVGMMTPRRGDESGATLQAHVHMLSCCRPASHTATHSSSATAAYLCAACAYNRANETSERICAAGIEQTAVGSRLSRAHDREKEFGLVMQSS